MREFLEKEHTVYTIFQRQLDDREGIYQLSPEQRSVIE